MALCYSLPWQLEVIGLYYMILNYVDELVLSGRRVIAVNVV